MSQANNSALLTEIQTGFQILSKYLKRIERNTREPWYLNSNRIVLKTKTTWYPIEVPQDLRSWFIQCFDSNGAANPTLLISFNKEPNLTDSPPINNYTTIPKGTNRTMQSHPALIYLQSDTDNTTVEMEFWN